MGEKMGCSKAPDGGVGGQVTGIQMLPVKYSNRKDDKAAVVSLGQGSCHTVPFSKGLLSKGPLGQD